MGEGIGKEGGHFFKKKGKSERKKKRMRKIVCLGVESSHSYLTSYYEHYQLGKIIVSS